MGRPTLAAVEPFVNDPHDEATVPPEACYMLTRWPSARFMAELPSALPGVSDYLDLTVQVRQEALGWDTWVDRYLAHVIAAPRLRVDEIRYLGPDRDVLTLGMLRVWGWGPNEDGEFRSLRGALRLVSLKGRRLASELLERPFPAFVLDYEVLLGAVAAAPESMLEEVIPNG